MNSFNLYRELDNIWWQISFLGMYCKVRMNHYSSPLSCDLLFLHPHILTTSDRHQKGSIHLNPGNWWIVIGQIENIQLHKSPTSSLSACPQLSRQRHSGTFHRNATTSGTVKTTTKHITRANRGGYLPCKATMVSNGNFTISANTLTIYYSSKQCWTAK